MRFAFSTQLFADSLSKKLTLCFSNQLFADSLSKKVFFHVSWCQNSSFLLRLSLKSASLVFDRLSSFYWQSGQNPMFLRLRRLSRCLLLLTVSCEIVCFQSPIAVFADSLVRFARSGAVFADSLVRIAFRRLWERSPGTSKTVPGLPEAWNRICGHILQTIL